MKDYKKEIIIKSAKERFSRYGLKKTSMTEIAADLRMGKATLYYYYTGKDEIFRDVILYEFNLYKDELEAIKQKEDADIKSKLVEFCLSRIKSFGERSNLRQIELDAIIQPHIADDNSVYMKIINAEESFVQGLISEHFKKQKISPEDLRLYSKTIAGTIRGILMQMQTITTTLPSDNEKEINFLCDFIVNSLKNR